MALVRRSLTKSMFGTVLGAPSNIVCDAGQARVLDLNLAEPPGKCRVGAGTYEYMAPEQIVGDIVGPATSVWGPGGILYRVLIRCRPFLRTDAGRVLKDDPGIEPLKQTNIDPRLCALVTSCFELDPAKRPGIANISEVLSLVLSTESRPASSE